MRSDRIEARVEPERAERIRHAARLTQTSTSAFMVDAASEKAERIIEEHRHTVVPAPFFDALLRALDEGTPAPALQRAAARARRSITSPS